MAKDFPDDLFRVQISLNGFKDENRVAWVIFPDSSVKQQYIDDEIKFCRNEEFAHKAARHTNHRIKTKDELLAKRVAFAKHLGYAPSRKDNQRWELTQNTTPIVA
jgi:hypothetical protein